MPRIRLIALDLDGTTLNSDHVLTEKTASVLRLLHEKGIIICLATGRGIASIQRYIEELNIGLSLIHISEPRDLSTSRMPSSA